MLNYIVETGDYGTKRGRERVGTATIPKYRKKETGFVIICRQYI